MGNEIIYHEIGLDPMYKTWHNQDKNMIIYMHSEGGNIVFKERIFPIKKGALCFIGSEKFHYTMPDEPRTYDRTKVFISPENHLKIISVISDKDSDKSFYSLFSSGSFVYALIPEEEQAEIEDMIEKVMQQKNDEKYFSAKITAFYVNLLILLDKYRQKHPSVIASGFAYDTINYVNQHISEDINVDDICKYLHISKYYFCRKFKKLTGMTIMQYILKTRITLSKDLLLKNIPIGQIAAECGFSSESYFSRAFKTDTGKTPSQYRKENKTFMQ